MASNSVNVRDTHGRSLRLLHHIEKILLLSMKTLRLKNAIVDVTLVSDQAMKKLNHTYRGKNKSTDVLSFSQKDMEMGRKKVLGDIIIAKETTKKQAKKAGHPAQAEYSLLAIHGLLHLLDYDHERKKDEVVMFALQKKLLDDVQHL